MELDKKDICKIVGAPSEREFSQITIVLNRRRNRLQSKSLLELLQGRNYLGLLALVDSEKKTSK